MKKADVVRIFFAHSFCALVAVLRASFSRFKVLQWVFEVWLAVLVFCGCSCSFMCNRWKASGADNGGECKENSWTCECLQ